MCCRNSCSEALQIPVISISEILQSLRHPLLSLESNRINIFSLEADFTFRNLQNVESVKAEV